MKNYNRLFLVLLLLINVLSCGTIKQEKPINGSVNEYEQSLTYLEALAEKDTSKVKQLERYKYFYSNKLDTKGTLKGYYNAVSQTLNNSSCSTDLSEWKLIGPKTFTNSNNVPFNGIYTSIIGDSNDSDFLIAGTENSGLWKWDTLINGWKNVTDHLNIPGIGITDIIMNPCNSNHLVASTGSRSQGSVTINVGLLESFDKGETWVVNNAINNNALAVNYRFTELRVNNNKTNCTTGDFFYYATRVQYGGSACNSSKILEIKSSGQNSIISTLNIANCGATCNSTCDWYFKTIYDIEVIDYDSFLVSSRPNYSLGAHIQRYDSGVWTTIPLLTGIPAVKNISISNVENNICYLTMDYNNSRNIYKLDLNTNTISFIASNNLIDATPSELVYSNTSNLLYLGNGNFRPFSVLNLDTLQHQIFLDNKLHADIRGIFLLSQGTTSESLLLANDGGCTRVDINVNTLGSSLFTDLSGSLMPTNQFYNVAVAQSSQEKYYASGMHQGIFQNGYSNVTNWHLLRTGDGVSTIINPSDPNNVFYQINSSIYRNGTSIYGPPIGWHLQQKIKTDPNNSDLIYWSRGKSNGKGYVSLYNNSTSSWRNHFEADQIESFGALGISKKDGAIYAANSKILDGQKTKLEKKESIHYGSFQAADLGSLTLFNQPKTLREHLGYKRINDIAIDPDNSNVIYLAISGIVTGSNPEIAIPEIFRVVKSYDGGNSWIDASKGLDGTPANSLVFHEGQNGLVFMSNEFGVFYRDNSFSDTDDWACFHKDMPPRVITNLDINYCRNELIASTFGNGAWKTDISMLTKNPTPTIIDLNTTWSYKTKVIYNDIRVKAGARLNIAHSKLKLAADVRIIVEPGAFLQVLNSNLTSLCEDSCWDGITVEGNTNLSQFPKSNQGHAFISGSTLSNAKSAVNSGGIDELNGGVNWSENGGILTIIGSTFKNNRRAISFLGYKNMDGSNPEQANASTITDSNFVIDDDYSPNCGSNSPFITLHAVNGLQIKGSVFEDLRTGINNALDYRSGVFGIESTFSIEANFNQNRISSFRNLYRGIEVEQVKRNNPFKIKVNDSEFFNCQTGIRFYDINNASEIIRNNVKIGVPSGDDSYGIVIHKSSRFKVEDNICEKDVTSYSGWTHGFDIFETINDNNPSNTVNYAYNLINNNTSKFNNVGFKAWGENVIRSGVGLEFLCNQNIGNTNSDFWILKPIQSNQGSFNKPAGNTFSCNGTKPFDIVNSALYGCFTYYQQNSLPCAFDSCINVQTTSSSPLCN